MKKLITLLSLTLASSAFALTNGDASANMNITARVIQPLTVKAEKMDFGKIIKGSTATSDSRFLVSGESGEKVSIDIPKTASLIGPNNENIEVAIKTTNAGQQTLSATATEVGIHGTLPTTDKTVTGTYAGTLTASVRYN